MVNEFTTAHWVRDYTCHQFIVAMSWLVTHHHLRSLLSTSRAHLQHYTTAR